MQQECEIAYNFAIESYTQNLKQNFLNRTDPFDAPILFRSLRIIRGTSIEEFALTAEITERFKDYDEYLNRIESYIAKQEETIIQVNENLAEK